MLFDLASSLCMYDLRNTDSFVLRMPFGCTGDIELSVISTLIFIIDANDTHTHTMLINSGIHHHLPFCL